MLTVGLILGIGIGAQTRTSLAIRAHFNVPPPQLGELAYRLRQQERAREALEAEVHKIRGQIFAYQLAVAGQQPGLDALTTQIHQLKTSTGLTELEGPGVVVELDDSRRPLRPGENPNEAILHNFDLAIIVNDLWVAGAEAIAINEERFVGTTPIRSVFRTFMVNERRLTPPIRIAAIGEPRRLASHVSRRGGPLELLKAYQFPTRVVRANRLVVPAYKGVFVFKYVTPERTE
ncbi:MAG: DUF881 domain-containing protein [Candidatus Methylomirabilaceae bacterium]